MENVITRFAPSPTGHLHLGGARTAIFNWLLARHYKGKFFLRIEDTDLLRSRQEYTDSILASMKWLGLDWDGEPVYQTDRTELYNRYVDQLLQAGHAYWCECTPEQVETMREEARKSGAKPKYNGQCRYKNLGPGEGRCVRLKLPDSGKIVFDDLVKGKISTDVAELDDMVIRRSDGMPTYNLAVVVDDHEMGVTHVLRGDDHISNTPKQILLYEALGFPVPVFGHVPMILGPDKKKLSKRHGARAVIEYETDGMLPQALVNYLSRLGWSHGDQEIFTQAELVKHFDGKNLNPASAAFDPDKLNWCDGQFMRQLDMEALIKAVIPFVKEAGLWEKLGERQEEKLESLCVMFRERAKNLRELATSFTPLVISVENLQYNEKDKLKYFTGKGQEHLKNVMKLLIGLDNFDPDSINNLLNEYVQKNSLKFKDVAPPIRTALMGFMGGSHLNEIMAFLGKEKTLARFKNAIALCN